MYAEADLRKLQLVRRDFMTIPRRVFLQAGVAAAALAALSGAAFAQTSPSRPVTIVVPAAAGGPTDTFLGQAVIVENNGAAAGSIAVGRVARAAPDGYLMGIGQYGNYVLNGAIYPLGYDLLNDFEPVALVATNPQAIVAKNDLAAKNLKELVDWLKANPGKATQGTAGAGSPSHVSGIYLQNVTGSTFTFVPYRGAAPAMQDLAAGQIDFMIDQASNSIPQVRGGRIKAFAVTSKTRMPAAPEIPTVDEAGLPGFYIAVWHGIWVPKGTPADIVGKLNAAVVDALADENVRKRLADIGQEIPPREQQTAEALRAYQKAEAEKWWPMIKAAGVKPNE
jgi:tripartite-type tricarboxylate transporter receptor subunit TctC